MVSFTSGRFNLGDISRFSIMEIWRGPRICIEDLQKQQDAFPYREPNHEYLVVQPLA
jgi:hypothetical protein